MYYVIDALRLINKRLQLVKDLLQFSQRIPFGIAINLRYVIESSTKLDIV